MTHVFNKDVPDDMTVMAFIKKILPWDEAIKNVGGPRDYVIHEPLMTLENHEGLLKETYLLYKQLGAANWQSRRDCSLYGLALSLNPAMPESEWTVGCFGHPRYQKHSNYNYFNAVSADQDNRVKNDYLDNLSFKYLNSAITRCPQLCRFFDGFDLSIHRATARTVNGNTTFPTVTTDGGMHTDGLQFESLNFNVCLSTNENFGFQYEGSDPIYAKPGDVNLIAHDKRHRVFIKGNSDFQRTHLIFSLSPWLEYFPSSDSWAPTKYFGEVHPLDMVRNKLFMKEYK